jgi:N-methylhydantoinase A
MRLGVDIGGTFTDLVAFDGDQNRVLVGKALNAAEGPASGLKTALESVDVEGAEVRELTHGTTLVTNLLIERSGATVGVICTRGFRDLLEIQLSWRSRTFDLRYEKTPPLVPRHLRVEIDGRVDSGGHEVEPIDDAEVEESVRRLLAGGVTSIVVALYNAYANPAHERQVEAIIRRIAPTIPITLSTVVDGRIGEYERASTAALNAIAVPRMRRYVDDLDAAITAPIRYMHSAGGMLPSSEARARPIHLAISGPAAGVLAGREVARQLGRRNAITMDMGGTSCDVCLIWDDELRYRNQIEIDWGVPARIRSLAVHTVGAGGGSIAWSDAGGALRVGPRSAGAAPGPACYGRGGTEPTVTDANLVLGILSPEAGLLGGSLSLDVEASARVLEPLGEQFDVSAGEVAGAIHSIVNANMAQAIREITVRQGIDPRACSLVAFGGAGPQHASGVAEELEINEVLIPVNGSVLSAMGLLVADLQVSSQESVLLPLERLDSEELEAALNSLADDAVARIEVEAHDDLVLQRFGGLRYVGQSHEVTVGLTGGAERVTEAFEAEHERLFGTRLGDPIEIVDVWVTVTKPCRARPTPDDLAVESSSGDLRLRDRELRLAGGSVPIYSRSALSSELSGPCLVEERNSVTLVPANGRVRSELSHLVVELS